MTPKEALYWCEQFEDNIVLADPQKQKMVLALQAMKECKKALEKQIPKKPLQACGHATDKTMNYCPVCGQALDWSDTE